MSITETERTEIFSRLGQLEGARVTEASHIKGNSENSNGGAKAFASILIIISIIGGMASIITPIRQQMDSMSKNIADLQIHMSDGHPTKVLRELNLLADRFNNHENLTNNIIERINLLEQNVAVLREQMHSGTQDRYYKRDAEKDKALLEEKIKNLQRELEMLRELVKDAHIRTYHSQ